MNFKELLRFLRECETAEQIDGKREEIAALIPEVRIMFDYDQKEKTQCHDLWMHSLHAVARLPKDLPEEEQNDLLYLAALLHDIGKPDTGIPDKKKPELLTYKGHELRGVQILTEKIIPALNAEAEVLTPSGAQILKYYISEHHDSPVRIKKFVRRHLKEASLEQIINLMHLQIADSKAQYKCTATEERVELAEYFLKKAEDDVVTLFTFSRWMV